MKNIPLFGQGIAFEDPYVQAIVKEDETPRERYTARNFYVIQLTDTINRNFVHSIGIEVVRVLRDDVLVVKIPAKNVAALNKIVPCFEARDEWKLNRSLLFKHDSLQGPFIVKVSSKDGVNRVREAWQNRRLQVLSPQLFLMYGSLGDVRRKLLPLHDVIYIGVESLDAKSEARVLDLYLGPNAVNTVHATYGALDGNGVTLSIKERSFDVDDIDLMNRTVASPIASAEVDVHATEMATIAAGAGISFINGRGVAPSARLTSSDFANLLPDDQGVLDDLNVSVQNHSYGTAIESYYGATAGAYDEVASGVLHVFSSGNAGMETPQDGRYAGISGVANLTGNFKMAKNILTVGSVDTLGRPQPFSSRGPAYDGRIKPELVAYSAQGSSNSAALVSGVAVMLQDAYADLQGIRAPPALIKAILINSAMDAGPPGIDFSTGYGNVDAMQAVQDLTEGRYFAGSVDNTGTIAFTLEIPDDARKLKVTLVWNDPAAAPGSDLALVNDLDLVLNNGQSWLSWVVDSAPGADLLSRPAERASDHLNNVEQVTIDDPPPGITEILVSGFDVPEGPQEFFLAWRVEKEGEFEWRYPTSNDNFPYDGETDTYFFWRSTLAEGVGTLQYRLLADGVWTTIADDIQLSRGAYRWSEVPYVTGTAQARFLVGEAAFPTDTFTLSRPSPVTIGFNCGDSLMVRWARSPGADSYRLFSVNSGVAAIEAVLVTTDTSVIVDKHALPSTLLSIQPVVDGRNALRWPVFDYNALSGACFVSSFFNVPDPEAGIYLHVQLGTIYGVERVEFQRERDGTFETIGAIDQIDSEQFMFLDDNPHQGFNRYRLLLHFSNGEQFASWVTEDFFLTTIPFIVFPNPVKVAGDLAVYSKTFPSHNAVFRLFRTDGSLVLTALLSSDRETIRLEHVAAGFYIFSITYEDGSYNGRLIVR